MEDEDRFVLVERCWKRRKGLASWVSVGDGYGTVGRNRTVGKDGFEGGLVDKCFGVGALEKLENDDGVGETNTEELWDVAGSGETVNLEHVRVGHATNPARRG